MTVQLLGTLAIGAAMLIAFNQKADVKSKERPTPKMTMLAVIILSVVGLVDTYLYILDLGTFTSYIQETLTPL